MPTLAAIAAKVQIELDGEAIAMRIVGGAGTSSSPIAPAPIRDIALC
jgi:hypothetical protein